VYIQLYTYVQGVPMCCEQSLSDFF